MTEDKFIHQNTDIWKEFETLLKDNCKIGNKKIDFDTLRSLNKLFIQVSGHLSYAQTYFPHSRTTEYLNGIVSRAHNILYITKRGSFQSIMKFYLYDIPRIIRKNKNFLLVSTAFFLMAGVFGFMHTWFNPENAYYFLPADLINNMNLSEIGVMEWNHPIMASYILSNNIYVSLLAFAYGIAFGLGTVFILFQNGMLLGSLSGFVMNQGPSLIYWSLILPHGVIELTAIFLSGAAGLKTGYALINPGDYKRRDALIIQGKEALEIMGIVIPMLAIAALIEGFFTPSSTINPYWKLIFSAFTGILLLVYFLSGYFKNNQSRNLSS